MLTILITLSALLIVAVIFLVVFSLRLGYYKGALEGITQSTQVEQTYTPEEIAQAQAVLMSVGAQQQTQDTAPKAKRIGFHTNTHEE